MRVSLVYCAALVLFTVASVDKAHAVTGSEAKQLLAEAKSKGFLESAKANVTRDFKDPRSAQFRGLFVSRNDALLILCGEVNAKNSFGAYVGFRKFYAAALADGVHLIADPENPGLYEAMEPSTCGNKIVDVR